VCGVVHTQGIAGYDLDEKTGYGVTQQGIAVESLEFVEHVLEVCCPLRASLTVFCVLACSACFKTLIVRALLQTYVPALEHVMPPGSLRPLMSRVSTCVLEVCCLPPSLGRVELTPSVAPLLSPHRASLLSLHPTPFLSASNRCLSCWLCS
jgi:hypothetical protein